MKKSCSSFPHKTKLSVRVYKEKKKKLLFSNSKMIAIIGRGLGLQIDLPLLQFFLSVVTQKGYPCIQNRNLPFLIPQRVSHLFQKKAEVTHWGQPHLMGSHTSWKGQKHRNHTVTKSQCKPSVCTLNVYWEQRHCRVRGRCWFRF